MSRYNFLFFCLAAAITQPAYGQEGGFFTLIDEDKRYEITLELGPSFMRDPVFRSYRDASGTFHPATKIKLKTARHVALGFSWRLNDWLRVESAVNFNSVDFSGAAPVLSGQEDLFEMMIADRVREFGRPVDPADEEDDSICDVSASVYCITANTVYDRILDDAETAARDQSYADFVRGNLDNFDTDDLIEESSIDALIMAESLSRADAEARLRGEAMTLLMGEYTAARAIVQDRFSDMEICTTEADANDCLENEVQTLVEQRIRTDEAGVMRLNNNRMGYINYLAGTSQYSAALNGQCADAVEPAICARAAAERQIGENRAGAMMLQTQRDNSEIAYRTFIRGTQEYTDARDEDEEERDDDDIRNTQQYMTALARAGCDAACALAEVRDAHAFPLAEQAIMIDEDGMTLLTNGGEAADGVGENERMAEEPAARIEARAQADQARADAEFTQTTSYAAEGTYFSVSGFLSAYVDIPLSSGLWLYGGGGLGVAWNHVKDGSYTRSTLSVLDETAIAEIQREVEDELDGVEAGGFNELGTALGRVSGRDAQTSYINSTVTSFAFTLSAGVRTKVFDDLILDSGYQMIWAKDLYQGADEHFVHLLRVGFVFNY